MTDHPHNPDDPTRDPFDSDGDGPVGLIEAVFVGRRSGPAGDHSTDPFDPWLIFVWWSLETGCRNWKGAVRAFARALRGLERLGFIDRRIIRRPGHPTHHGDIINEDGSEALVALAGERMGEAER